MSEEDGIAYNEWSWAHIQSTPYVRKENSWERGKSELSVVQQLSLDGIFDYAAGNGGFVRACRDAELTADGCEVAPSARQLAIEYFGIELYAEPPDKQFNVLCLHSILEHVFDGNKLLNKVLPLLKPEGTLVIRTPLFNYQKQGWWAYGSEHLCVYSNDAVCNLLKEHGYALLKHYGSEQSTYVFKNGQSE